MKKFLHRYGNILFPISVIIVIVHIVFFALPRTAAIASVNAQVVASQKATEQLQEKINLLKQLQTLQVQGSQDFVRLKVALPLEPLVEEIYLSLETIAARTGVTIARISPETVVNNHVPIAVTVTGSYESVVEFLKAISRNLRPATIDSLALQATTVDKSTTINAQLRLSFLYAQLSSSDSASKSTLAPGAVTK